VWIQVSTLDAWNGCNIAKVCAAAATTTTTTTAAAAAAHVMHCPHRVQFSAC
jgi:hypothetical protein